MAIISNAVTIADAGAFSASLGSFVHIKTITITSNVASISFVHGSSDVVLDSTYPIYKFEVINLHPDTNKVYFGFQGSTDSGSNYGVTTTATNFGAFHTEGGSDASVGYQSGGDLVQSTSYPQIGAGDRLGNHNDNNFAAELTLFNPSSTTFVKNFLCSTQHGGADAATSNNYYAGYFNTTSAINAMNFKFHNNSSNIQSGKIKLYGLKDS